MDSSERLPRAPKGLSTRCKGLWSAILADFDLSARELALLTEGLRALDRSDQARAILDEEGLTFAGRYGTQAHPMITVERISRLAAVRILRELGLDPSAIKDARPPRIAGRYDD